jgi:2-polyprenyl-3-methyl-5-hydroxy-6-metoxy-1,4-benzoquinol methylase
LNESIGLVRCLACDVSGTLHQTDKDKRILQCSTCDAIFDAKEFLEIHNFSKYDGKISPLKRLIHKLTKDKVASLVAAEYIKYLKSKTDMKFKNAFDVGAQFGNFVNKLNKIGIDAWGIEGRQENHLLANKKKIEWGYFNENYKPKAKYDLISLSQMLCFLRDNYKILKLAKNMLNDGGLIFVTTVNPQSSFNKRFLQLHGCNMILSHKNFVSLHDKLGLDLIDYSTYDTPYYIEIYSGKRPEFVVPKYLLGLKRMYVPNKTGIGNHAFLLLRKSK